ncbi:MAG: Eco57I restriction-modification methylase domain-containing protein [Cyanobacteria bacterium]|nr:Eco57I restriction-modification methylase domain-containing protein [Cyanobacteriota bacterium]
MRVTFPALFHGKTLQLALKGFEFPADLETRHGYVKKWASLLTGNSLNAIKETSLHGDFLGDIFRDALGYRNVIEGQAEHWELHAEKHIAGGGGIADGALGLFSAIAGPTGQQLLKGRVVAPIELKGTRTDLDTRNRGQESPVDQGWRYANYTAGCQWVIVSNYRELRLYHLSKTPACCEQFFLADLADLETFKQFYFLLCRENFLPSEIDGAARSRIDDLLAESNEAEEAITERLYRDYRDVRQQLVQFFKGRYSKDWGDRQGDFIEASQKILDRILFVAFCEDRKLLPAKFIKEAHDFKNPYEPSTIWQRFKAIFRWVDQGKDEPPIAGYNGGLFRFDPLVDETVEVPDWLCTRLKNLTAYDFETEVSVDVLGRIFEQSVTDLEELRSLAAGESYDVKHGQRKTQGVFYTPSWVTQYMVETALGGYLNGRAALLRDRLGVDRIPERNTRQRQAAELAYLKAWREEIKTIRVLDPACGSGAFLIAAFNFLARQYEQVNTEIATLQGGVREIFDLNKAILNQNLYGVDLSFESVEITKLSLCLQTAERGQALTNLDDNIKMGNSIVADRAVDPRAFDWAAAFPAVMGSGGFDVVLGNPPYVRQELLSPFKPYLQAHYECYDGVADLYVYFYERGVTLLKPGGVLSYIVTNKWLRSGYGEPLRKFFAERTIFQQIVDFGHAPVFRDADTFPCIIKLQKPLGARGLSPLSDTLPDALPNDLTDTSGEALSDSSTVRVCAVPREELGNLNLPKFVEEEGYEIPRSRLSSAAWSLENPQVEALMQKIRQVGVPLTEFAGTKPYRGILTGFNQAFLIDGQTRQKLISEDPKCSEIIKPYLRGQDIKRWHSPRKELWLIFSRRGINIEEYPSVFQYLSKYRNRLEPRPKNWNIENQGKWQGRKFGPYNWYEIQDPIAYVSSFDNPKIIYQEIQFHSSFCWDESGNLTNNKCFILPTDSKFLLSVLCAPLIWWHNWQYLPHMKDEALTPAGFLMKNLPIAPPTETIRRETEDLASELIELTRANQEAQEEVINWLRFEFNLEKPGQKLSNLGQLNLDQFRAELRKRIPKTISVSPKQVKAIDLAYSDNIAPIHQRNAEILQRERRLSDLINQAYQLTPEEIELMWKTAPPRMPIAPPPSITNPRTDLP